MNIDPVNLMRTTAIHYQKNEAPPPELVAQVMDVKTNKVIRQIPSVETVNYRKAVQGIDLYV